MKIVDENGLIPGMVYDDGEDKLRFIKSNKRFHIFKFLYGDISSYIVSKDGYIRYHRSCLHSWAVAPFKFGR